MSNWRFKKGIFPLPPVKKGFGKKKNLPNLFVFLAQLLLFWKIVSFIHIVI